MPMVVKLLVRFPYLLLTKPELSHRVWWGGLTPESAHLKTTLNCPFLWLENSTATVTSLWGRGPVLGIASGARASSRNGEGLQSNSALLCFTSWDSAHDSTASAEVVHKAGAAFPEVACQKPRLILCFTQLQVKIDPSLWCSLSTSRSSEGWKKQDNYSGNHGCSSKWHPFVSL